MFKGETKIFGQKILGTKRPLSECSSLRPSGKPDVPSELTSLIPCSSSPTAGHRRTPLNSVRAGGPDIAGFGQAAASVRGTGVLSPVGMMAVFAAPTAACRPSPRNRARTHGTGRKVRGARKRAPRRVFRFGCTYARALPANAYASRLGYLDSGFRPSAAGGGSAPVS